MKIKPSCTSLFFILLIMSFLISCSGGGGSTGETNSVAPDTPVGTTPTPAPTPIASDGDTGFTIGTVNYLNNQVIVSGTGLTHIISAKIQNGSS